MHRMPPRFSLRTIRKAIIKPSLTRHHESKTVKGSDVVDRSSEGSSSMSKCDLKCMHT